MLADWFSLLELLVGSNGSDGTSHEVTNGGLLIFREVLVGQHELLNSNIECKSCLVLSIDALKKCEQIELEAIGVGKTFEKLLDLLSSEFFLRLDSLGTEEDFGGSFTDVLTEAFPVSSLVLGNGVIDITVDINTIDDEIFTNVPGERW
jgi:hypothetical protein